MGQHLPSHVIKPQIGDCRIEEEVAGKDMPDVQILPAQIAAV